MGGVRFPGEDGGRSLAEMAQRDLDAALQLLADRAQYITGATGAAIALRRRGMSDMLCRASTGSNAPELGALLSTEFGLSGESVRTKRALRCDDAERDARVNREVCRQLGIASVVVMPVVNDDEVLGVFELFSGKANAFGERDLSAVRRLSEMVETAVRLAHATESLTEKLRADESSAVEVAAPTTEEQILDVEVFEAEAAEDPAPGQESAAGAAEVEPSEESVAAANVSAPEAVTPEVLAQVLTPQPESEPAPSPSPASPSTESALPKKKLFWSVALDVDAEAGKPAEADQSHVPPVMRGLRKCEVCGFPVSAGRVLCVECEEKKWRGQLKRPQGIPAQAEAKPAAAIPSTPKPEGQAFAAAAHSGGTTVPHISSAASPVAVQMSTVAQEKEPKEDVVRSIPAIGKPVVLETAAEPPLPVQETASPELVLSAGLEPSQSWFVAHKYILGVLLLVAAVVAAVFLFR